MSVQPRRISNWVRQSALLLVGASCPLAAGCQQAAGELPVASATPDSPLAGQAADNKAEARPESADVAPLALTWEQLEVGIPPDSVFQPWMMKTSIKSLAGRSVRLTGYMHGGVAVRSGIREFVLLRNLDCPFGREGEAHHALRVDLQDKLRTTFTQKPITVEGVFRVDPYQGPDGNTWALYRLEGTKIEAAAANLETNDALHSEREQVSP